MPHERPPCTDTPLWLGDTDARLVDHLHGGFPLVDRPFAAVGATLGLSEDEVIERLRRLLAQGVLTRFGPLFQIERAGGRFVLAAIAVPEARFADVAALVNGWPEVAHNYRREHALNMWFVVATETQGHAVKTKMLSTSTTIARSTRWPMALAEESAARSRH